jgi:hypothetical protein
MWAVGFTLGGLPALAGVAGIAYKLCFLDEDTLRERLREAEDPWWERPRKAPA